ncbi:MULTISPECIES: DUF6993 domain-containing protein [Aurantimicrobium]|uniref:DUF6993 domain-containing protein n=1 Tax=Aurantimicrobium photophilum TaxID=1987356 RepID=A0A2Z3S684_9MICO|nr:MULTISPECIES: hypothetical protein [Aurantimicrobium]AWR21662.1 hypothetical protein AURMO_01066 [Aurantimicrobium photophilum]MDH6410140.1 pectin methylesterase-like acyl-CoA thioesterase [Aurantimicrobium minutum]
MKIRVIATALALSGALALTGCSASTPDLKPTETATASASATPKPTKDPVLLPNGSAKDNLYYFTWIIEKTLAADPAADSYAVAQAVGAAGFDPATVQFTFSRTAAGLAADTSEVAVQFGGQCVIGQFGPVAPKVISRVLPVLATGGCLLGTEVQSLG